MNKIDLLNAFRPSSSERILTCYKAFEYEYTEKDSTNVYATKGIKLHKLAEILYKNPLLKIDTKTLLLINEKFLSKEDSNLVKSYIYYIRNIAENADIGEVEKEVYLNNLSPYFKDSKYGMVDFVAIKNNKLYIVDLKTGHTYINVKENYQLYIYAYLVYKEFKDIYNINSIRITIYQYNKENYIDIDVDELVNFIKDKVITNLDNIFIADNLQTNPNSKVCKWCKGRDICDDYLE